MPKMAQNRCALHDVLAQGASNRDITVFSGVVIGGGVRRMLYAGNTHYGPSAGQSDQSSVFQQRTDIAGSKEVDVELHTDTVSQ